MKKALTLLLAFVMVAALFGACAPQQQPAASSSQASAESSQVSSSAPASQSQSSAPAAKKKLGVVMIDLVNQFFVDMMEAGNVAAKDYNVDVTWKSADGNLDNQIALMENFIEQKVDCILVNPIDNDALKSVIEKAANAGIPTVTMAGIVDNPNNYNTLYNDYADTKTIAEIDAKVIGEKGKVALLYGNKGNVVSDLREKGFMEGMAKYPGITVISQPTDWDPAKGQKVAQDIVAANKDLKLLHCVSDAVTIGAQQAIIAAGKQNDIKISSYDGNKEADLKVKSGEFLLTLLTGSKRVGYWNIKIGANLANGIRPKENTLYLSSHFIMNDDFKKQVTDWGLADGLSILTPDDGIAMADNFQADLGPTSKNEW